MRITRMILPAAALLALATTLEAQGNQRPPSLADAMRAGFNESSNRLIAAVEAIPEAQLDFKPATTVRSIRQLVAHIADGSVWYCKQALGERAQWTDSIETANLPKAQLIARLRASVAACNAVPASAPGMHQWLANVMHVEHHYGNLVTSMRAAGLTPPNNG